MSGATLEMLGKVRRRTSAAQYEQTIGTGQRPMDYDRAVKDHPIPFQEFADLGIAVDLSTSYKGADSCKAPSAAPTMTISRTLAPPAA